MANPNEPLTNRTHSFYTHKEIQRSYNYIVYFSKSVMRTLFPSNFSDEHKDLYATSVELPAGYDFKKEYYNVGPFIKSFPVLDHNGFEFTIKMEEDDQGTVKRLIELLNERIISGNGYYNSYSNMVIDAIIISVFRPDGMNVYTARFKNCYLLKSSVPNYSYNSSEKIEYDLTFNADHFETEFT